MRGLFLFLYNYRAFLIFLVLEGICTSLIVQNNSYQGAAFFNSSNKFSASILVFSNDIKVYFSLKEVNEKLATENAVLRRMLQQHNQKAIFVNEPLKPKVVEQYQFKMAKVINNSTRRANNFITINKGSKDGIKPGMGVIGTGGIIGKVKVCSDNFSTVTSLLHSDMLVSSQIKRNGAFCSTKWNGKDARTSNLLYLPKHVKILKGDTVVTSGFNSVYPPGVIIGFVKDVKLKSLETYYDVEIELSTDFNRLSYVYVIDNKLRNEIDSLETKSEGKLYE